MIEINLLPWREDVRLARLKKWRWLTLSFLGAVTLMSAFFYFHAFETTVYQHKPKPYSHRVQAYNPFQKVQFVGYLRESNRLWGLVKLASGEVREVQVGSRIDRLDATVKSITEENMVMVARDGEHVLQGN